MLNFGILLKSYKKDLHLAERLIASFNENNPENLQLFIVVPQQDLKLFESFASATISVLSESSLSQYLVQHEVAGIRPGYINQEIVKLAFWELRLCDNYFCVDSDAVFIRPLSRDDFMHDAITPYTVLVEDNELKSEPKYFEEHWKGREVHLRKIQELVGLNDRRILTCHGHQVFSSQILSSLKQDFMEPRGWSYAQLLEQAPYEFSWYNMWLQKTRLIPIQIREPLVKTFHHQGHHLESAMRGVTLADLARGYLAIVVNSNFAESFDNVDFNTSLEVALSRYVPPRVLSLALASQFKLIFSRRSRRGRR